MHDELRNGQQQRYSRVHFVVTLLCDCVTLVAAAWSVVSVPAAVVSSLPEVGKPRLLKAGLVVTGVYTQRNLILKVRYLFSLVKFLKLPFGST